jgi:hypothetical protein
MRNLLIMSLICCLNGYLVFSPNTESNFAILPILGSETPGEKQSMIESPNLKLKFYGGADNLCILMTEYEPEEEEFIVVQKDDENLYKYVSPNSPLIIGLLSNQHSEKKNEIYQEFCSEEAEGVSDFKTLLEKFTSLKIEASDFAEMSKEEKVPRFANEQKDHKELWDLRSALFVNQEIVNNMDFEFPSYNEDIDDVDGFVQIQVNSLGDQIKDFLNKNPVMNSSENKDGVAKVVSDLDNILSEISEHLKSNFESFGYIENRKTIIADYENSLKPLLTNKLLFFFSMMKKLRDTEYYEERDCFVDKMLKKIHIGSESTELNDQFLKKSLSTFGYYLINLYLHTYNLMFNNMEDEFMVGKYKEIEGLIAKNMPDLKPDSELSALINEKFVKTIRLYKLIDPTIKQMKQDFIIFVQKYVNKLFEINQLGLIDLLKSLWSDTTALDRIMAMLGSGSQQIDDNSYFFKLALYKEQDRRVLV